LTQRELSTPRGGGLSTAKFRVGTSIHAPRSAGRVSVPVCTGSHRAYRVGPRIAGTWPVMLWLMMAVDGIGYCSPLQGRSWTQTEQLLPADSRGSGFPRLGRARGGDLTLILGVQPDTSNLARWRSFRWDSLAWAEVERSDLPQTSIPWPTNSLDSLDHLVWIAPDPRLDGVLLHTALRGGRFFAPVDTLALTSQLDQEFSGAFDHEGNGWVIRSEQRFPISTDFLIRVFHRHVAQPWREIHFVGVNEDHCAIAPAREDSALIVYAGQSGLAWALESDTVVVESGTLDDRPFVAAHPRLRVMQDGSLQLMWTDLAATYSRTRSRGGLWSPIDTLLCSYAPGETFVTAWIDVSRQSEFPAAAAWSILGYGFTLRDGLAVGVQRGAQWDVFELPASPPGEVPSVARDRYGEVWVSWSRIGRGGSYFMHSYVSAQPTLLPVSGTPHERTLHWKLSEPAPGSFWRVERAEAGGPWGESGRVVAGDDTVLSFVDRSFVHTRAVYRVVACSEDARFVAASGTRTWEPGAVAPRLVVRRLPTTASALSFTLFGVPDSEVVVELYDIQGRRLLSRSVHVSSPVEADVDLPAPAGLPPGVYILRARARVPVTPARVVLM